MESRFIHGPVLNYSRGLNQEEKMQESGLVAPYQAYVLRLWSEEQDGQTVWRFALLEPQSGQRLGFGTLNALFDHLSNLTQPGRPDPLGET